MRYNDAPAKRRLQLAAGLAVVVWVLLMGGEAALPWSDGPDDHGPHAVAPTLADHFAVVIDHPHVRQGSAVSAPDTVAAAVVPRVATTLVALGLAVAGVAAWIYGGDAVLATVRGPPRTLLPFASGRQLLARLCIARR